MNKPLPSLTLSQYIDLIEGIPLPTRKQRENFVDYVAHSHSWYKHLPRFLPGVPFYFYIDRYAGCDLVRLKDGTTKVVERAKRGFHYAAVPTAEYRHHFGYLSYSCNAGSRIMLMDNQALTLARDKIVAVPDEHEHIVGLPQEIMKAGETHLTAIIHTLSLAQAGWDYFKAEDREKIIWPEESGGETALESIFERCRMMREPNFKPEYLEVEEQTSEFHPSSTIHMSQVDTVLYALLAPERLRQFGEMKSAIDRVCDLADSHR